MSRWKSHRGVRRPKQLKPRKRKSVTVHLKAMSFAELVEALESSGTMRAFLEQREAVK